MKQVELVFVPAWLKSKIESCGLSLDVALDYEKLASILSGEDILTYLYANPQIESSYCFEGTPFEVFRHLSAPEIKCGSNHTNTTSSTESDSKAALVWKSIPIHQEAAMQKLWCDWHYPTAEAVVLGLHTERRVALLMAMLDRNNTKRSGQFIYSFTPINSTQVAITVELTELKAPDLYNRHIEEFSKIVGYFDNPSDIWGDITFRTILERVGIS